jgi:hypothetical protein
MLYTTLNEIRRFSPCEDSWKQLLTYLNKTKADDEPLDFKTIIEAVGIKEAIWYLRTQEFKDYYKLVVRVAYSVLPIFENKYPEDKRPRSAIEAVEDFMNGEISKEELETVRSAAWAARAAAVANAAYWAAYAADAAANAAWAANVAWAANAANAAWDADDYAAEAYAAADANAWAAATADAWAAAATAAYAAAREKKRQEIEQIFIEECLK